MGGTNLLIAVLTVAPALLLLGLIWYVDHQKREPKGLLWLGFAAGIISVFGAILVGSILMFIALGTFELPNQGLTWGVIFFISFIIAGLVEEVGKFTALRIALWKKKEFDEIMDGIVYMMAVSLGFAALENLFYNAPADLSIAALRAVTAVPAHAVFSGVMGYFIGLARVRPNKRIAYILLGLFLAIFLHGTYDVFAFGAVIHPEMIWGSVGVVVIGGLALFGLIRKALKLDRSEGRS